MTKLDRDRTVAVMALLANARLLLEPETRDRLILLGLARRTGRKHRTVVLTARVRQYVDTE